MLLVVPSETRSGSRGASINSDRVTPRHKHLASFYANIILAAGVDGLDDGIAPVTVGERGALASSRTSGSPALSLSALLPLPIIVAPRHYNSALLAFVRGSSLTRGCLRAVQRSSETTIENLLWLRYHLHEEKNIIAPKPTGCAVGRGEAPNARTVETM